ncbi:MAG: hypothetical protein WBW33_28800, partial [Bryobacteraceae bacterium]
REPATHYKQTPALRSRDRQGAVFRLFQQPARPYFELVRGALGDLVDGEHFFDIVADDVVYEVLYDFPGWPRIIQGRADLMAKFQGYRIPGPWDCPRDRRKVQQSVLLNHKA